MLDLQRDHFGAEVRGDQRVEMPALELRVAGDAAVDDPPVERGDDLHRPDQFSATSSIDGRLVHAGPC